MIYQTDGILLIDKAVGETSHSIVKKVRAVFGGLKNKKVGHAGTLDPFATGLLVILLGQGTRLSSYIMSQNKQYLATMTLGIETDTLDSTGKVLRTTIVPNLKKDEIRKNIQDFVGDIEQTPPAYSAVKLKGTPAYKMARKGIEVELKKRMITISFIRIISINLPDITMEIGCSKGTYIRSLAADIGRRLGPGGYLKSLRRLSCGDFGIEQAVSSKEISETWMFSTGLNRIISLKEALPFMDEIEIGEFLAEKIKHGYQPVNDELFLGAYKKHFKDGHIKLIRNDKLVAVIEVTEGKGGKHDKLKIARVFL
ncbi:MAG: tRNA pseudouridine(55) synthase TruB [Desulfobacteraceae bacterium 4484_190.1]|nr:MAG: tRNA pseudouridine(55) synthase TruB [Desulfobacteraceae bacterium 4484_190.1]